MPAPSDHSIQPKLFWAAVLARVAVIGVLIAISGSITDMSRDSAQYHREGILKAEQYRSGEIDWSLWIDEAWREVVGVVYYFFGPNILWVIALNALLCGAAAIITYRIAVLAFDDRRLAASSAMVCAVFPSTVYFTAMPLKEAPAMFAILCVVLGTMLNIQRRGMHGWQWIAIGMLIITGLRIYLLGILSICMLISLLPSRLQGGLRALPQALMMLAILGGGGLLLLSTSKINLNEYQAFEYYDLNKINEVREDLVRGNARMYQHESQAAFTDNWIDNISKGIVGASYAIFSINPTNITSNRQYLAIPELIFFLFSVPCLWTVVTEGMKRRPYYVLSLLVFSIAIIAVYCSVATNAGALYRWRVQVLALVILLILYGAALRGRGVIYALLLWVDRKVTPRTHSQIRVRPAAGHVATHTK